MRGQMLILSWLLYSTLAAAASVAAQPHRPLTLSSDGKALVDIVVSADAAVPEKHAAQELAEFLGRITGARFTIRNSAQNGKHLYVGAAAATMAVTDLDLSELGDEGVCIQSVDSGLILCGKTPRAALYAVYTFLQDQLGCRWWSSKASTIPHDPAPAVAPVSIRYNPPLEYREVYWTDAFDSDFSARNRLNGHAHRLDEQRGGRHTYQGFVHTFYPLIPPEKYFDVHPDWFSEIGGKRVHDHAQLCLTNEQMRAELVKNLKARLRANPAATIASVSQNDWQRNCRCAHCRAVDEEEGSPAGSLLRFVNAVAADIEEEFPHVAISTLAYQYTRKPPKITRPRDNVIVRLCSIECSFSVPLSDQRNASFRDDIVGWSKICDRLYIWDYTTNFRHYFHPHPNLRVLGPNVRFFVNHGTKGIFEQGAYTSYGAEMAELRAWVLAQLLWNPSRDDQALIREFLDGYYGPAGKPIGEYLDIMHDSIARTGDYLGCLPSYGNAPPKFLSWENLSRGWELLGQAETLVSDDPELRNRVQVAQLPLMYSFMRQWKQLKKDGAAAGRPWPLPDDIQAVHDRFMEIAGRNNVTRLCEWYEGYGLLDEALKNAAAGRQ